MNQILTVPAPHCPLCGSKGTTIHKNIKDKVFGTEGSWNLSTCTDKTCNQIWLNPMPKPDEIWKAYQSYYTHDESKSSTLFFLRPFEKAYLLSRYGYRNGETLIKKAISKIVYLLPTEKAELDFNFFYIDAKPSGKLLDVGCGNGIYLKKMDELGWQTTGIDFDQNAVDFCVQKGLNVRFGDLISQRFADQSFDVITFNHVVEHLFDPIEVFKECHRILKPGGQLIIVTPNNESWMYRFIFKQNWRGLEPPRHIMIFNRRNLTSELKKLGFGFKTSTTTARNEFFMYAISKAIKKACNSGQEKAKIRKYNYITGKFFQLLTCIFLLFNKNVGGEILIKATR